MITLKSRNYTAGVFVDLKGAMITQESVTVMKKMVQTERYT